jgi:outer membrane cobalamin receptor
LYPNNARQASYALFSNQIIKLPSIQFSLGNRIQFIRLTIPAAGNNRLTLRPVAWVGNVTASHQINPDFNFIYGWNTGFRAPNIDDLGSLGIVDFRYEVPNYDLKPEKSNQIQLGFKWNGTRFNWETYLYYNKLRDLITRKRKGNEFIDGYPVFVKENEEDGFITGLESHFQYFPGSYLQIFGSVTYTYGQNTTKNEPLRRIPPIFGHVNLQYRKEKYWAKIFLQMAGKQERLAAGDIADNRIGRSGTAGWSVINLSNGILLNKLEITLTLQNLLNEDYKYHGSGINAVGRSLIFGFNLAL